MTEITSTTEQYGATTAAHRDHRTTDLLPVLAGAVLLTRRDV